MIFSCTRHGFILIVSRLADILHPSAQLVLVTALHGFLADLLHRAYASKPDTDRRRYDAITFDPPRKKTCFQTARFHSNSSFYSTAVADHIVRTEDVRRSIVSTAHFDFLTNRHLGSGGGSGSAGNSTSEASTAGTKTIKQERQ